MPILVLFFCLLLLSCAPGVERNSEAVNLRAGDIEERVRRVENSLLASDVILGEPVPMNIRDRMSHYEVPGVSVAVINNGEIEWARGYGVLEGSRTERVTPGTLFQAGSISKPVAAIAALSLVAQGRLSLEEDVNDRLLSWKVPKHDFTKDGKVSLKDILSHRAGMNTLGFPGYSAGEPVPTLIQILNGAPPANTGPILVDSSPGGRFRYSGGGYTVLQQLLIDVTGQTFPGFLREAVLDPIGMANSTFQQPLPESLSGSAATGHDDGESVKGNWHTYPEMAAAGLWTTPSDLALLAIEMQKAIAGKSSKVLPEDIANLMVTPAAPNLGFGLGFSLQGEGESARFSHNAGNEGFRSILVAYAGTGKGAAVMTNANSGTEITLEILRAIAYEYDWSGYLREKTVLTAAPLDDERQRGK